MLDKFRTPMLFVRLFGCLPVVVCLLVGSRRKYSLAGARHGRALEIFLNDGIESNFVLLCCWEAKNIFFKSSSGGELHIHFSTQSKRKYSGYDGFGQEIKPTYGYGQNMGMTSCSMHGLLLSTCSPDRFKPQFLFQAPLTLTPPSLPVPCKKGTSRNIPKGSDGGYNFLCFAKVLSLLYKVIM